MDPAVFKSHLDELHELTDRLDPDPARGDWLAHIRVLEQRLASAAWLLDNLEGIPSVAADPYAAIHLRNAVIDLCAGLVALLHAAQRSRDAQALLLRCAKAMNNPDVREIYTTGASMLTSFTLAMRARWLIAHGRDAEGRKLAATLSKAPEPLAAFARRIERTPIPVESGPTSFTINGFGTKLYFDTDRAPDGSVIRTRFFTALFIPVIPLDAWRVIDAEDDKFYVKGKVPLSRPMRYWQRGAGLLLAGAILWGSCTSFLNSPERHLRLELEEVATLEDSDPERALTRYEALASQYSELDDDDLAPVAEGWVRLATRDIAEPMTPEGAARATAVIARFEALPARMHTSELARPFVDVLLRWVDQLGHETGAAADASLDLLAAADRFAPADSRIDERVRATRIALADQLAEDWPIEALLQYDRFGEDAAAQAGMTTIIESLPKSPTLFAEIGLEVRRWVEAGGSERDWAGYLAQQGEALAFDVDRQALLERNDEAELRTALAAEPTDQGLAVAIAQLQRGRGELDEAYATLAALGKPGILTHHAQYLLASIEFERGNVVQAATLLEQMLRNRLPAFEDARRDYDREFEALRDRLISAAEQGRVPLQHKDAILGQNEEAAREAFQQWLFDEIGKSARLEQLQDAYTRRSDIVPVAILLGTIQLERAREATGEERQRLLDAAESTFLSFRGEAQGMPSYHASLGQVYYRLGKNDEGDAELQVLLADPDPMIQVMAAGAYRDVGRFERAREILDSVYEKADPTLKQQVAHMRAILAQTLDERQEWLERADQDDPFVRASLVEVEGERLRLAGKFAAADAKYAQAYELTIAQTGREASTNNAALTLLQRHACTGDLEHVHEAAKLLERSVASRPDDAIVISNYAHLINFQTTLALIDRVVPVEGLRISPSEARYVLDMLLESTKRDELLVALRESPERQRTLETFSRLEALAPSSIEGYSGQAQWLIAAENYPALAKLIERLRALEGLDTSDHASAHASYLDGSADEQSTQEWIASLTARAAARAQAKRASASAKALLHQLDGSDRYELARIRDLPSDGLVDIRAAIESFEQARALWPEGVSDSSLADALILVAILELAAEDNQMNGLWREHGRQGLTSLLHLLLDQHQPLVTKLAAKPSFQRSVELRKAWPDERLGLFDVTLARVMDDSALRERARASLRSEQSRLGMELAELLSPYDASFAQLRALIEAELG